MFHAWNDYLLLVVAMQQLEMRAEHGSARAYYQQAMHAAGGPPTSCTHCMCLLLASLPPLLEPSSVTLQHFRHTIQVEELNSVLWVQSTRQGLVRCSAESQTSQEHDVCQAGMARTSLHMGDTKQGRALALDSNSPQLCKECAQILESQDKQQVLPDMHAVTCLTLSS